MLNFLKTIKFFMNKPNIVILLLLGLIGEKQFAKANKLNLGMSSLLQERSKMSMKTLSEVYLSAIDSDSSDDEEEEGSDQEND
jgi:hypothetical protein